MKKRMTYKGAGVDIDAKLDVTKGISRAVKNTYTKDVLSNIGSFGGLFAFDYRKYKDPVLVSSTDSVGTKLKLAAIKNDYRSVGMDIVNHCVNDILVLGAKPLFFLDYIAIEKFNGKIILESVEGMAKACKMNRMSLIGGETAELPGIYRKSHYDLAGFVIGVVEKDKIITGEKIKPKDVVLGLRSSGLHTNGYSLAIKVIKKRYSSKFNSILPGTNQKIIDALLKVHMSYLDPVTRYISKYNIHGLAHLTGGGFFYNIERILPERTGVIINKDAWKVPELFSFIKRTGNVDGNEMYKVFNMGIGMVMIVDRRDAGSILREKDFSGYMIGEVVRSNRTKVELYGTKA